MWRRLVYYFAHFKSKAYSPTVTGQSIPAGVDAVIYGHTHQQEAGRKIGGVLVVQPKNWGASVARVDFRLDRQARGRWKLADQRSRLIPVTEATAAAADVLKLGEPYHQMAERYLNTPVAQAPVAMDGKLARMVSV